MDKNTEIPLSNETKGEIRGISKILENIRKLISHCNVIESETITSNNRTKEDKDIQSIIKAAKIVQSNGMEENRKCLKTLES